MREGCDAGRPKSVIALVFRDNGLQWSQAGGHLQTNALIRPLFEGPIDMIGDVHGEIDALRSLLGRLGYNETRRAPGWATPGICR